MDKYGRPVVSSSARMLGYTITAIGIVVTLVAVWLTGGSVSGSRIVERDPELAVLGHKFLQTKWDGICPILYSNGIPISSQTCDDTLAVYVAAKDKRLEQLSKKYGTCVKDISYNLKIWNLYFPEVSASAINICWPFGPKM